MRNRIFIPCLVLLTIGIVLWSSVAMVMAGDASSSSSADKDTQSSATDNKTSSSKSPTKAAATDKKSDSSSDKSLDNGPKVAPKEAIKPIETIQQREPIAPRG